jgi:hypothetical protein
MKEATREFHNHAPRALYLVPVSKAQDRASMISQLQQQIRAGTYNANMRIVAERMLAAQS